MCFRFPISIEYMGILGLVHAPSGETVFSVDCCMRLDCIDLYENNPLIFRVSCRPILPMGTLVFVIKLM